MSQAYEETCLTCGRRAAAPFRQRDRETGRIINGCVDDFHSGHLVPISADSAWHERREAKALRKRARERQAQLEREARALERSQRWLARRSR